MMDIIDNHKYFCLLLVFVFLLVLSSFWLSHGFGNWLINFVLLLAFLWVAYRAESASRAVIFLVFLSVMASVTKGFANYFMVGWFHYAHIGIMLWIYALMIFVILKEIVTQRITVDLIVGALCVYIIIAILFSNLYIQLDILVPGAFDFGENVYYSALEKLFDLLYFSFTTLTTVGFGDIVPMKMPVKAVVILEEICGIFYLAVLVSRLISTLPKAK